MTAQQFTAEGCRLHAAIADRRIDEVRIAIVPGGFIWRLFSGTDEVYSGPADRYQVASMLQATEMLINTELGIPSYQLVRGPKKSLT
jgi:hypothetical protein